MRKKARFGRPDFSEFVVHFTKNSKPCTTGSSNADLQTIRDLSAKERLFRILQSGCIKATNMPWTNKPAVCFTECTWSSLMHHARHYSGFGVGFEKSFLFAAGGGPAIYLPPGLMEHQKSHVGPDQDPFDEHLFAFVTPFMPAYAPKKYKENFWPKKKTADYSHEREWRVPHDLIFDLKKVAFVIVDTYEDMAQAPTEIKDATGRENWLIMSNYERIEEIWPIHVLPKNGT